MLKTSHIVEKPWGHEELWASAPRYVGKILFIKEGHRLSRQYHRTKDETIMVLEGTLTCEAGPYFEGDTIHTHILEPGGIFHVRPATIHRFCAPDGDVRLIEVSTPEVEDIVRLEDDYRRIVDILDVGPI
jgi:mannose-6-phosphate isomerase-like protein (cupin superfamily)|tara:strand:+ start:1643 stop:2032 length:390 start_codon:yes stop_codon:yes gene_type:complete